MPEPKFLYRFVCFRTFDDFSPLEAERMPEPKFYLFHFVFAQVFLFFILLYIYIYCFPLNNVYVEGSYITFL